MCCCDRRTHADKTRDPRLLNLNLTMQTQILMKLEHNSALLEYEPPHWDRAACADGSRLLLTTHWHSYEAVVSVDVDSKAVWRVTPDDGASWLLLCVCSGACVHLCRFDRLYGVVGLRVATVSPSCISWRLFPGFLPA